MLVSLSPLTLYSSSHHSSLIGTLSCVGTVQKNLGKLTLIGARGQPWGFSFAVRGLYAQNVPWGPLQGFFVVLVALFGVCGARSQIQKEDDSTCEIWLRACEVLFGLQSPE